MCEKCKTTFPYNSNPEFYSGVKFLLFTETNCPHCPTAKEVLKKVQLDFDEIDCGVNEELADKYEIRAVPTLVLKNGDDFIKLMFA
jgi:glutaredoxin